MRICIVAEGCYPYSVGGVSSWIDNMIRSFPEVEFVLLTVVANRSLRGQFRYTLPDNVTEVYEAYLEDMTFEQSEGNRGSRLPKNQFEALRGLMLNEEYSWDTIFEIFQHEALSVDRMLMGEDFLRITTELYNRRYPEIVFSDFLWTLRSIYLPLFLILRTKVPKADIYHCVATGYAGVLGCLAKHLYDCRLLVSEHGIYTREREEELIKATWVQSVYKRIWIEQFYRMGKASYDRADIVTSLYAHARELQIELGAKEEKLRVTPNGIDEKRFSSVPGKTAEDEGYINVGAVVRVTAIKDIKTMIQAFAQAKNRVPSLRLWIMGPTEEEQEYARECFELVEMLDLEDVVFTGRIDVREYIGRMDFMILTSISEGQPLTILEGYAAKKPVIATDVGNCRGLIYGEGDSFGEAGILCHIMNVEELGWAMVQLARDPARVARMGQAGYERVLSKYRARQMHETYEGIYRELAKKQGVPWPEQVPAKEAK